MNKVIVSIYIGIIALLIASCGVSRGKPIIDNEKKDEFRAIESSFNNVNSAVLDIVENYNKDEEFLGKNSEIILTLVRKNDTIVGVKGVAEEYSRNIIQDLKKIDAYMMSDFEFIVYTDNRISFEGDGTRMVIHSLNGKAPDYFYYKGDHMSYTIYALDDQWFILIADKR